MPGRIPSFRPSRSTVPTLKPRARPGAELPDWDRIKGTKFTSSRLWRAFRRSFLAEHPTCADCEAEGRVTLATTVHHVRKRADDPTGSGWFDPANCISLCKSHHDSRTGKGE
jgi:5-methylcytosine-specific restriction enzyme A